MTKSTRWTRALMALGLGLGATSGAFAADPAATAGPAQSQQPTTQDLMAQIDALKAKVAAMEKNQQQADSRDIDATVAAVLKDANAHSMLIDGTGVTAGFDKQKMGFFIGSEDGSSYFHPGIVWWFRNTTNYRQSNKNGGSDTQNGFENALLKPYLDGTLFTKDFTYKFQWAHDKNAGTILLDDAYAAYVFAHNAVLGGDLAVKGGQYKPTIFHEQYLGDQFQFAADRSYANAVIGGGDLGPRVQGVSLLLTGANTPWHGEVIFDDGGRSINTDFQKNRAPTIPIAPPPAAGTIAAGDLYWGAGGRVEYKFFGNWADYGDFTSHTAKDDLLVVAGGVHVTQATNSDLLHYTVDAQYKSAKHFSLYGAFFGRHLETRNTAINNRDDLGGVAQFGYEVTRSFEPFVRYSLVHQDGDFVAHGQAQNIHELTAGLNWYLGPDGSWGHHAKVTVDLTWMPNGAPVGAGTTDILAQPNKKDEFLARCQFQFWI